ncbi:DNA topoisomerase IB [Chitinophaga pendula]|uniref:DNA topoisomerase IB n=1 Tax=Chitinophaga TaxID=79328 RepID=UPI000BAF313B|nr:MULTISPECIES: DNA topoisomerase IB [Chitinophaga]ASZ10592.1 DNA topoisomerase I [Chitinophaga sp. MD30]UCJ06432.1 DNA topoisomerase IB [Chitinophaga pendula]
MDNLSAIITDPVAAARAIKLRYVKAGTTGYSRQRHGKEFHYLDQHGERIRDTETLLRIRGLVLPPAWEQVWICPYANGHLQATGIDALGRKQYRYHATWAKVRNETKYDRLLQFGEKLPQIRRRIQVSLRKRTLDKEKVLAIALSVMQETLIRVGNSAYEKLYGSHGLTTLRNQHVKINGNTAFFQFKGKKGVMHKIALKHASLARLLQKMKDIPGQELFQYYDESGEHKGLDSGDINEYLKECAEEDFTCKDFRTWSGTVNALNLMADLMPFESQAECKRNIVSIIDGVAGKLGNTRAVCKKYYVHPQLLLAYENCQLDTYLQQIRDSRSRPAKGGLHNDEKVLLQFLKKQQQPRRARIKKPVKMIA